MVENIPVIDTGRFGSQGFKEGKVVKVGKVGYVGSISKVREDGQGRRRGQDSQVSEYRHGRLGRPR